MTLPHFTIDMRRFRLSAKHPLVVALWLGVSNFATNAPAQTPAQLSVPPTPQTLGLVQARDLAFQRNWDLLAAKSGIDAAAAQLIIAKEFPNPTFSWSIARIGSHDSATPAGNDLYNRNYDTILQINQLIEIGGKRRDRQSAARAGVAGAKARFLDAKRTLDQGVTKAYLAALLAQENARILKESSGYLQHEAEIAAARFKAGGLSDSDKKQIEINAEQFALQARAAETSAVQARIAVEVLMGIDQPTGGWTASDALEQLMGTSPDTNQSPVAGARPDVLAAETDLRGGRDQLRLARAERIPDPTFSLGVEHNPPGGGPGIGPDVNTIVAGVSFPLPFWNLNGGSIKAAQASVDQFETALGKARGQAAADLATAQSSYAEAHDRWLRYRDVTAPKSGQVRESVAFAYDKGGASLVDLLNAEQTDNTIRLALAQAMSDTASAAADLAAARKMITESDLNAAGLTPFSK